MRDKFEEFKAQLAGWCSLNEMKSLEGVWRTREQWSNELPEWVNSVLYIEDHELFHVFNGYSEAYPDDMNVIEKLFEQCGVWWEQENACVVWVYDTDVLDNFINKEIGIGIV